MRRGESEARRLAREALHSERRDSVVYYTLLILVILSFCAFLFVVSVQYLEDAGYAASVSSQAGYITEVDVRTTRGVERWGGFYGLVLRVDGFTQQLSEDLEGGDVTRSDIFFDCIDQAADGGPEFYASTNDTIDLSSATVIPATTEMIDSFIGCTDHETCANNTFTHNITIYLGDTEINNVPATYTYKYTGQNQIFDIGALNVSGALVFIAHINQTIQPGYNPDNLVNYQMLLPVPINTTQTYYFYSDPFDSCPPGGLGNQINATVWGYIINSANAGVANATVTVGGYSTLTNESGYYNLSTLVLEGTFSYVVQADGYDPYIDNVTITFADNVVQKNATLTTETPSSGANIVTLYIFGTVTDTGSTLLSGANISFGNGTGVSNSVGQYNLTASVVPGDNPLIAILTDYDNYVAFIASNASVTVINHNITMSPTNLNQFITGPFSEQQESSDGDYDEPPTQQVIEATSLVLPTELDWQVREGTFIEKTIRIFNFETTTSTVAVSMTPEIDAILDLDKVALTIASGSSEAVTATVYGTMPVGVYRGTVTISGDISTEIPAKIEIVPRKLPIATLDLALDLFSTIARPGGVLKYRLVMNNLLTEQGYKVDLKHLVTNPSGVRVLLEEQETVEIGKSLTLLEEMAFPEDFEEGEYLLSVEASYLGLFSSVTAPFIVAQPLYLYSFFGIPLWLIFVGISMLGFIFLNFFLYKRHVNKKKRYHLELHTNLLPKPGDRSIKLGKIAERTEDAFYQIDDLTTHMIVAGATGGGKSIAAQVFVEEMLKQNIAVLVFDPTAQWSGMLRKCDDKNMMQFYPKFGLKPTDARAFPGSVHPVTNFKQSIDINKYINPGQIQVFTLNKLDPSQIDTFVAGVINNIFKSDPKEFPGLRVLLVFDEVHRLLPKFGGSGKGFLQIERACREFRKWGLGVMLVSQVLSDFVGEIKANINTELQMRVAEENDLERIRERYGGDALKSLVRASIGTGMIQNAEYNRGLPYFVTLRPILHSTRRLSDEILEKYKVYNDQIDDLSYQIEQLEALKIDVFDLKMELKLVKDKLMSGNFTVVDIYLEGLKPRLEKQWATLGKKPKKLEVVELDVSELEAALKSAQKDRAKWKEAQGGKEEGAAPEKKVDPGAKIVVALTLDNGAMISSLNELCDVLPGLDDGVYKIHVTKEKNDFAAWANEQYGKELGDAVRAASDKQGVVTAVKQFLGKGAKKAEDGEKAEGKDTSKEKPKEAQAKKDEKK